MTNPLLTEVSKSLKRTNELRGELAVKAAVLRDAQLALRVGTDPQIVGALWLGICTRCMASIPPSREIPPKGTL